MVPRLPSRTLAIIATLVTLACDEHVMPGPEPGDHLAPSISAAVAWDVNHAVFTFDEPVTRWTAEYARNYHITGVDDPVSSAAPAGAMSEDIVSAASLHSDGRTVTVTTAAMEDVSYQLSVSGVSDTQGNVITKTVFFPFHGTTIPDTTPPEVVYRQPSSAAAAISARTFVVVAFSEAVQAPSVFDGLRVHGEGAKLVSIRYDDLLHFTCEVESLQPDTPYTVSLTGVKDLVGNVMPDMQWGFTTGHTFDTTVPFVVSVLPVNRKLNVGLSTDLTLTFSEPMDPYAVILRPSVSTGTVQWTNGGRMVTYETEWLPGRQYTVQIRPGEMRDQAGNASTKLFTLVFSTGDELEAGGFAGTMTGDPQSAGAENPDGGLVFAGASPTDLYISVVGSVNANGTYNIARLRDGVYYPFYVKDTDGDRIYQPKYGDAVGVYGISDWFATDQPRSVTVADALINDIDFDIYDPTAVCGLLLYHGVSSGPLRVGLFRAVGFDPLTSVPVVAVAAESDGRWDFIINSLDTGPIPDDDYYVVAYLDVEDNGVFDPSIDPMGAYGGATPIAVDLARGRDAQNTNIELHDPATFVTGNAIRWPDAPRSLLFERVVALVNATEQR